MSLRCRALSVHWIVVCWLLCQAASANAAPLQFTVTYDPSITDSFTGRVYVMLTTGLAEPRFGPSWHDTQPFFAMDVVDWKPDTPLVFDDNALGYPGKLSTLEDDTYSVQAVMRRNPDSPSIGMAAGNAYSEVIRQPLSATAGNIDLRIAAISTGWPFRETDRIKLVELKSELLSAFHGRDIIMRAAVILPGNIDKEPNRLYPALYWIGGFGSDHYAARFMAGMWDQTGFGNSIVRVVLDPLCYGGHHVFADSDNNGPRGRALVEEFIPYLERTLPLVPSPTARFVSGHSSGGWSSLWLQITYPDFFGGAWSIAPDPVDFRDFQRINIYKAGANMYVDELGNPRPLGREGDQVVIWYEQFARMETVYGDGGQLRSFEWVFSPPTAPRNDAEANGQANPMPMQLFDRATGAVDATVAEHWKRYDIRLTLEENWQTLGPKLSNGRELNVFMGEMDNFYLEGAVKLLRDSQQRLGSEAVIEIVPKKDHGSIATPQLRHRIDREIIEIFNANHPEHSRPIPYD